MKKKIVLITTMAIIPIAMFAVADTTVVQHHEATNALVDFFKNLWSVNGLALVGLVWAAINEWLGNTGKVKPGSVGAVILGLVEDLLTKLLNRQFTFVSTVKAKFMKQEELSKVVKERTITV